MGGRLESVSDRCQTDEEREAVTLEFAERERRGTWQIPPLSGDFTSCSFESLEQELTTSVVRTHRLAFMEWAWSFTGIITKNCGKGINNDS